MKGWDLLPRASSRLRPTTPTAPGGWVRVPISHIEDLSDAIYGAGLSAVQMSRTPVTGSLLFAERDGVTFSSGRIEGRVSLHGSLSESQVTLGLGITLTPGSRQWLREVSSGDVGLFMPGDEHDALYNAGSLYAAATLSEERAEELGAAFGRVLKLRQMGGSAIFPRRIDGSVIYQLRKGFEAMHATGSDPADFGAALLRVFVNHLGRDARQDRRPPDYQGRRRIVRRCREYIESNLHTALSIETLAMATGTSTRTLFRSFTEVLGETPLNYVRRLRLHRIRRDLLAESAVAGTVTTIATRWGVSELGRFAGCYHAMFGEMPSRTLSHRAGKRQVDLCLS